jgi:hypothetical protein
MNNGVDSRSLGGGMRVTLKAVNQALAQLGTKAELAKGSWWPS